MASVTVLPHVAQRTRAPIVPESAIPHVGQFRVSVTLVGASRFGAGQRATSTRHFGQGAERPSNVGGAGTSCRQAGQVKVTRI